MSKNLKVFKYPLISGVNVVTLPVDHRVLHTDVDPKINQVCIWALIPDDESRKCQEYIFRVFGTGNLIPSKLDLDFIGTCIDDNGFVYHIFKEFTPCIKLGDKHGTN